MDRGKIGCNMTIPRNLACKESLVYVPEHLRRTCCQNRYRVLTAIHAPLSDILEAKNLLAFILSV